MKNTQDNILIVDDNSGNLKLLKSYLNQAGYKVVISSNGYTAIKRTEKLRPILILMDVKMPDMDGFEVCKRIKSNPEISSIPIIFVTATTESEDIAKGFQVGGVDYITKPISKIELLARVKNHLKIVQVNNYLEEELEKRTRDLHESEERYRTAIEGTQDGLWDWNLETNEAFISSRFETMLGFEPGELPKSGDTWDMLLHPDDAEQARHTLEQYLGKKTRIYESTFRMRTKKGSYRWITGRGKAQYNEQGKAIRIIGFNTDITERKKIEIALQQKNKDYQKANKKLNQSLEEIKKINIQLEKAKEKAEESDRLKTSFLNNLSHEIRTPMNGILGFADLLKKPDIPDETQRMYLDTIEKSGIRMLDLINDLIDISKIESGQLTYNEVAFNINEIINETVLFFGPEFKNRNIQISKELYFDTEHANLISDKNKLEQILYNLIQNAIKFTENGEVLISYRKVGSQLIFLVKDTGIGISKKDHEIIFNRFMQVENPVLIFNEGLGLGLSICKAFVEFLHGEIWLESEENKGSSFYFSIPYLPTKESETKLSDTKKQNPDNLITILIAEDDEVNYLYLDEILSDFSIKTIRAKNGKEAVQLLPESKIDLILMDIKMPVMNGYEALNEIRKKNATIPVIAQTAHAMEAEKKQCLEVGFNDYISKPFKSEDLIEVISKHVSMQIA